MNSFYIYSYQYKDKVDGVITKASATVIFCSSIDIDEKDLQSEIRTFYQSQYQTDKIFVVASNQNLSRLKEVFITQQDETFKGIPKRQETVLNSNLYLLSFDKKGCLSCQNDKIIPAGFLDTYKNEGLQQIFISRGGLIVSEDSHHYVFPSGKHCDRFLRTGNILLYSPEVYFLAFCLLEHFDEEKCSRIYCDTSSINSIAFALFDLKNNFLEERRKVSIESFSSYDGLYQNPESYTKDSFLLISASTSANIIKYILDKHHIIERENIIILYFLGGQRDYSNVKDQVLCNLTKSETNETGIPLYPTYTERDCEFCKKGSFAVPVSGDVFLLEKPKLNKILLAASDREKNLSWFVQTFKSRQRSNAVLKVHYKEASPNKYEVYIDVSKIVNAIKENNTYADYQKKLDHYIQQYIPSNTRYLLHLNDEGSKELANHILKEIAVNYKEERLPICISMNQIPKIDSSEKGSVVVVTSCISNGKNLLYISRALRRYDNLQILYFASFVRTVNKAYLTNLKSNLTRGRYGPDTNGFVAVETLFCSNEAKDSPWLVETDFLKDIILFIQNSTIDYPAALNYFETRKQLLLSGSGDTSKGLDENIFFDRVLDQSHEPLRLRKNFAFWDFDDYVSDVTQSEVYFTISNIVNSLRNSGKVDKQLRQAAYVRNLLDPSNFNRFNDGVIQASLLRAANANELAYAIDVSVSEEMYNILETLISFHEQEQGEALLEFLYALAIKKLSLTKPHLLAILDKLRSKCDKEIFKCFHEYLYQKLIVEPENLKMTPLEPYEKTIVGEKSH